METLVAILKTHMVSSCCERPPMGREVSFGVYDCGLYQNQRAGNILRDRMNTPVPLYDSWLLPLGKAKAAVSFGGTPQGVLGRQQNERPLPFRRPNGIDSPSVRRKFNRPLTYLRLRILMSCFTLDSGRRVISRPVVRA